MFNLLHLYFLIFCYSQALVEFLVPGGCNFLYIILIEIICLKANQVMICITKCLDIVSLNVLQKVYLPGRSEERSPILSRK